MKTQGLISYFLLQELLQNSGATDASGNAILSDIGVHMQQKVCIWHGCHNYLQAVL
jgi:hypothetical protein